MATKSTKTTIKKVPRRGGANKTNKSNLTNVLDPRVFNYPVNDVLINQVLHVYRSNLHQNTSKVKNRGEVARTTKKVYKQKGTGNARHGARSAPIYVGGGVAHGPSGLKPAPKKVNRKMKAIALAGILTSNAKGKLVDLISVPEVKSPSTKSVKNLFKENKTLLIHQKDSTPFIQSAQNLKEVSLIEAEKLNPFTASLYRRLIITPNAHEAIVKRLTPLLKTSPSVIPSEAKRSRGISTNKSKQI